MQTFLPYPDFFGSMESLDNKRLGKQRVETLQILNALTGRKVVDGKLEEFNPKGWTNHPAAVMWRGYETALSIYGLASCTVWTSRGFKDTCTDKFYLHRSLLPNRTKLPKWIGNHDFHRSHQSNLVRKDPVFYSPKFPGVPGDLPYVWPVER
jgi:hypothetical protein